MRTSLQRLSLAAAVVVFAAVPQAAFADRFDDGLINQYYEGFAGKRVAFVASSMGMDLTQGWMAAVQRDADRLGYELIIRDSNWNIDAGAQALEQLITEKPDILIFHNDDMQAYAKLVTRAMAEGINVIQLNMKTPVNGDAYIGGDWYAVGVKELEEAARLCEGTSGKIAVIQGPSTSPPSQLGLLGITDAIKSHPNLSIVSTQAGDWDPSKANAIATTVLKQNPDLCAIVGLWDNMDIGAATAIEAAGLKGKVHLITEGGGNAASGCKNIESGAFSSYVKVDTREQAYQVANIIQILLQTKAAPGASTFGIYTEPKVITKDNLEPSSCWTLDQIKAGN